MAVEIGTLVLKGRFGPHPAETPGQDRAFEEALEVLRFELLREIDDKLQEAERRAWER